jgi:hypothetical protein
MKDCVFSTIWGACSLIWFSSVRGVLLLGYNQGLGRRMQAASDIFIGRYIGYFIRPAWQQVYGEAF